VLVYVGLWRDLDPVLLRALHDVTPARTAAEDDQLSAACWASPNLRAVRVVSSGQLALPSLDEARTPNCVDFKADL
jgi:hypothetical protein